MQKKVERLIDLSLISPWTSRGGSAEDGDQEIATIVRSSPDPSPMVEGSKSDSAAHRGAQDGAE
jgi:hypothetical protein